MIVNMNSKSSTEKNDMGNYINCFFDMKNSVNRYVNFNFYGMRL